MASPDDARTRDRVARSLHDHGPQSAGSLSASFGLTPAAVRRHLDALIAAGRVCEVPERKVRGQLRGRGRPAKLFALTDDGHSLFPQTRYSAALEQVPADRRPAELAAALTADGYAASAQQAGAGIQVCQHHCPIAHVAADFPQLCEAETQMFVRLLGTHVQRLATIAHGDGICTTHIPLAQSGASPQDQPTSGEVTA